MIETKELENILGKSPNSPGIYKMLDEKGEIIYIGKAKDLKKRVKQYFQKDYFHSSRTKILLEKVKDIELIAVDSELEATILESNLIKELQPKYNVIMKDDKSYVYIKITKEDFPRVQIVREILKDNAKYIGPKTAAHKVKETFKLLKKIFPFRHCGLGIEMIQENIGKEHTVKITNKVIKYPCLDYYIKRCIAPCIGKCKINEYQDIIKNVENFLEGKADQVIENIKIQMQTYAQNREFEKAAKLRDKLLKIQDILEKQKVQDGNTTSKDVINYLVHQNKAYFNLFQIRSGKLIGQENFILSAEATEDESQETEILEAFIEQYYAIATDIPKEIHIPHKIHKDKIEGAKIIIPKIGDKNKLLEMSLKNARIYADKSAPRWNKENDLTIKATEKLQEILKIEKPLKRIECYDISHLSGTDTVASMVVFENGAPKNNMYRKFKIKTVQEKPDDFKSMEEVLTRRLTKIAQEIQQKEYKFKKAPLKKQNELNSEKDPKKIFFTLEKNKIIKGYISISEHDKKIAEIKDLWVEEKERGKKLGYNLIKNIIQKSSSKRFYIGCEPKMREYYMIAGFEDIKKVPEEINQQKNLIYLVYDKIKHKKDESFSKIPDLIVIDGGKGQLSSASNVLKKLELNIPHISLAKRLEEIFVPKNSKPIILERNNEALKLLQRARDEAHRFAISFNRDLRSKRIKKT
ncbi:hypothetical protein COU74_03485 [Candidatus Peregrinibacteria bacterium CG10_big_fil_rev_8_21_14_0_10_36_19]|nr:MAG: hypothetical protein COU74_03485 [Candidatus Peregrinibacteria bacterium CG10_big_fil_rev_8_21_14_0_10_36_19]